MYCLDSGYTKEYIVVNNYTKALWKIKFEAGDEFSLTSVEWPKANIYNDNSEVFCDTKSGE